VTPATRVAPVEPTVDQLRFVIGSWVKVAGIRGGVFKVCGYNRDGSLSLYGGPAGHGASRAIMPTRCRRTHSREDTQ
jgi:hypothetical protein